MAVTDFFAGEIATELLKTLATIVRKSCFCKSSAESLIIHINALLPTIEEIKYIGVELKPDRQFQLDRFSETLKQGLELANKVLRTGRLNVYKNLRLTRKMEKLEKTISQYMNGPFKANILADVHHLRFDMAAGFERMGKFHERLEQRLGSLKIGGGEAGGLMEEALKRAEEVEQMNWEGNLTNFGLDLGKRKVKEMVLGNDSSVVGIRGIGGSGKTTLAKEIWRDEEVRTHFNDRILFLTVSQSPNVDNLLRRIGGFIMGNENLDPNYVVPQWSLQCQWRASVRTLVILDDVWSLPELQRLISKIPGCTWLVVSRFKFQTIISDTYEVELLRESDALSLFCHSAFGQKTLPPGANVNLVKQIVSECKGLPLALKVIGASLKDQAEMYWASAKNRLSRGEPIDDSHESDLLARMEMSVKCLAEKVRQCFLDLGAFPEDKKIPLDVLINMWVELHDIDEEEAFAILVELANKNLLTLVKDARDSDVYSSYYDIAVTQHDVLRDLALHISNRDSISQRERLLMPRRETALPKEWERNSDKPFNARIVSIHTGEMNEMDWFQMEFPKAEVLILNFSSKQYFLPSFLDNMPKLRALIIINYNSANATLRNFPEFLSLTNLRSLWLEKVSVPQLSNSTLPLKYLRKLSIILCDVKNSFDQSLLDLPYTFPSLYELTIDHCEDLFELPPTICEMQCLKTLSITNCHNLKQLPANLGKLRSLQILRLYACPELRELPSGICELLGLKYLDISQCLKLSRLPQGIDRLSSLEKIDMRECSRFSSLPKFAASSQSLRHVICDDEVSWLWESTKKALPNLHIQVAETQYSLDWLDE
ncbi:probable disease resistance protein At4g33300 [Humulus lupulus]|uniref:probable disease resistance protein At4g33300 n=1 Tax=Humulus lupulus TaxID=3486 RepID=UPI002B401D07|nr:probable disease resistance protein At4g33300 [Humulus lupulus]